MKASGAILLIHLHFIISLPLSLDTFLDTDGLSIGSGTDHICVLTSTRDSPIGGRAICWGNDDYDKLLPPKNVIITHHSNSSTINTNNNNDKNYFYKYRHSLYKLYPGNFFHVV